RANAEAGAGAIPGPLRGLVGELVDHPMPPAASDEVGAGALLLARLRRDPETAHRLPRLPPEPGRPGPAHARLRRAPGGLHAELLAMALGCDLPPRAVPLADLGERIGLLAGAAGVTLPYLAAAAYHGGERRFAASMGEEFFGVAPPDGGP